MAKNKQKDRGTGYFTSLFLVDILILLIVSAAVIGIFYLTGLSSSIGRDLLLLCAFFVLVKVFLMSICDLTGIGRKIIASVVFVVIGDIIVVAVNFMMAFGVSMMMLGTITAADAVLIAVWHLIWKKKFSKEVKKLEEKREWLSGREDLFSEGDDEMTEIFTTIRNTSELPDVSKAVDLPETEQISAEPVQADQIEKDESIFTQPENEPAVSEITTESSKEETASDLFSDKEPSEEASGQKDHETILEGAEDGPELDQMSEAPSEEDEAESVEPVQDELFEAEEPEAQQETEVEEEPAEVIKADEEQDENEGGAEVVFSGLDGMAYPKDDHYVEPKPEIEDDQVGLFGEATPPAAEEAAQENPSVDEEGFDYRDLIEKRSGRPFEEDLSEVNRDLAAVVDDLSDTSVSDSQFLNHIDAFAETLGNMDRYTKDQEILASAETLKEHLEGVTGREAFLNRALDDLSAFSTLLTEKSEADQEENGREASGQTKEEKYVSASLVDDRDADVYVSPDEVILQSGNSEIIINEEDLQLIQKYMKNKKNKS